MDIMHICVSKYTYIKVYVYTQARIVSVAHPLRLHCKHVPAEQPGGRGAVRAVGCCEGGSRVQRVLGTGTGPLWRNPETGDKTIVVYPERSGAAREEELSEDSTAMAPELCPVGHWRPPGAFSLTLGTRYAAGARGAFQTFRSALCTVRAPHCSTARRPACRMGQRCLLLHTVTPALRCRRCTGGSGRAATSRHGCAPLPCTRDRGTLRSPHRARQTQPCASRGTSHCRYR